MYIELNVQKYFLNKTKQTAISRRDENGVAA